MNDPIARICLLRAGTDERQSDLRSFARWVDQVGPQGLIAAIERIRDAAELAANEPVSGSSRTAQFLKREVGNSMRKDVLTKVMLLLTETGLSKSAAANLLLDQLLKEPQLNQGTSLVRLPSPKKVAFETWLRQILDRVPESIVLHVATRLRNDLARGERSRPDWALKNDTE